MATKKSSSAKKSTPKKATTARKPAAKKSQKKQAENYSPNGVTVAVSAIAGAGLVLLCLFVYTT